MRNSLNSYLKQIDQLAQSRKMNGAKGTAFVPVVPEFYVEALKYVNMYYPGQGIVVQKQEEVHVRR